MTFYLQPSIARTALESAIESCQGNQHELHPVDHALAVRIRFLGAGLVGLTHAIYCCAIWVIMSVPSMMTLGYFDGLEGMVNRAQSLCGAGVFVVAAAVAGLFDTRVPAAMSKMAVDYADKTFARLGEEFEYEFDREADELRLNREKLAYIQQQAVRPEFFDQAVQEMRCEREQLRRERIEAYPVDSVGKHEALVTSQAQMYAMLCRQRCGIAQEPFTQVEVDQYYVSKTFEMADEALEWLYWYPKHLLMERVRAWGKQGWDGEGFQEKCLKLFQKHRIDTEVESLVENVKGASGKEKAFQRFVKDINALVRREKQQIDNAEKPSMMRRLWWIFETRLNVKNIRG